METTRKVHEKPDLGEMMMAFRRRLMTCLKRSLLTQELTFPQMEALSFIGPKGRRSMDTIAEHLQIKPPSATAMIRTLQKKGLVTSKRDEKDRRIVYIELTGKTKRQMTELSRKKEKCFEEMLERLSERDKGEFIRIMHVLTQE